MTNHNIDFNKNQVGDLIFESPSDLFRWLRYFGAVTDWDSSKGGIFGIRIIPKSPNGSFSQAERNLPWRSFTLKELSEGVNPNTCVEMGFNSEELARQYADTVTRPELGKNYLVRVFCNV